MLSGTAARLLSGPLISLAPHRFAATLAAARSLGFEQVGV